MPGNPYLREGSVRLLAAMAVNYLHLITATVALAASPLTDAESLVAVNARLDKGAAQFQTMSAKIEWIDHTKVINEDSRQAGNVRLKRAKTPGAPVIGLISFTEPDVKTVLLSGPEVQIYYPKMKTVQVWELGREGDLFFQFVLLGFGSTSADLRRNYTVRVAGSEMIGDRKTTKLQLTAKTKQVQKYITSIDLWIPEDSGHPIQEVLRETSGDTKTIRYSQIQMNTPLTDKQLTIEMPPGVKKEYPQRAK